MDLNENILQLGALAIIFLFAVKEFFSYLKSRNISSATGVDGDGRNEGRKSDNFSHSILQELQLMNSNHLHSIEDAINVGNREIVKAINDGNLRTAELLGEIKGGLRR